jgi:O-antigen ligase
MKKSLSVYLALAIVSLFLWFEFRVGPVVIRPFDGLLFIGLGGALAAASMQGKIKNLYIADFQWVYLALTTYVIVNGLVFSGAGAAFKELLQKSEYVFLMLAIGALTRHPRRRRLFVWTLVIGCALAAIATAGWHVANGHLVSYKRLSEPKLAFGLFAYFMVTYLVVSSRTSALGLVGGLGAFPLMLLSGERKGWLAFAAGIAFLYIAMRRGSILKTLLRGRLSLKGVVLVAVVLAGGVLVGSSSGYVVGQIQTLSDMWSSLEGEGIQFRQGQSLSNQVRLFLLQFTIETVKAHPWWGIGVGEFKEAIQFAAPGEMFVSGAHSEYQRYAVETGLTGLGLYLLTWALMIRHAWRVVRRTDLAKQTETALVVGLVVYGAVINLFLGGGALNILFLVLPAGLLQGILNEEKQHASRRASRRNASAPGATVPT